jgi:hypothetical protein
MQTSTHRQTTSSSHRATLGTAQRPSVHPRRRPALQARSGPGNWALVQVWDGAVLARFDDEASARGAIVGVDHDEVVVLRIRTLTVSEDR